MFDPIKTPLWGVVDHFDSESSLRTTGQERLVDFWV